MSVSGCLSGLGDSTHLERERALKEFELLAKGGEQGTSVGELVQGVQSLVTSNDWAHKLGGLQAAKVLVEGDVSPEFDSYVLGQSLQLLEDQEVRVRLAVGDVLHALASKQGLAVYKHCHETILRSIHDHFEREQDESEEPAKDEESPNLLSSLLATAYKPTPPGKGDMRHGTEGWKCLETSMKAFQHLVEGTGPAIGPAINQDILDLLYRALHHPNRFVRETSHFTLASLCVALRGPELLAIGGEVAPRLADGMSDSWSQVRYAACTATRSFLTAMEEEEQGSFLPVLIGPMCLNRYYIADGVRLYAQDTWQRIMKDQGRQLVAQHIDQVVAYYIAQSKASNHAVREAACAVLAELMEKVEPQAVKPHISELLKVLILCFKDASWPVRDAACTACGRCVKAYPFETSPLLDELYALWVDHLWDNIPTVRENTSVALGKAVDAYDDAAVGKLLPVVRGMLPMAFEQPSESEKYSELENVTTFGVAARKKRDNDPQVHTGQDMFSCGSLSPHFSTSRLVRSDGCMDYGFSRGKQPWEASDGAVYLVRELALRRPQLALEFLPQLSALARLSTFQHAFNLHETIWRCLPAIARAMGAKAVKAHLELFLGALFLDLACGHQLAEVAAGRCLGALRDLVGPNILAGRLTEEQQAVMASSMNVPPPGAPELQAAAAAETAEAGAWPSEVQQQEQQQRHVMLGQKLAAGKLSAAAAAAAGAHGQQQQQFQQQQRMG